MAKLVWLSTLERVSRMASRKPVLYLFGLVLIVANLSVHGGVTHGGGVVVESVATGSSLEKAGIWAGDVLLSWKRLPNPPANPEPAEGVLRSYFDWQEIDVEQEQRGTVVLAGRRDGEPIEFTVEPGFWEAEVRPGLPAALEETYSMGKALLISGDLEAAVRAWRSMVDGLRTEGDGDLEVWIALRIGEAWGEQSKWAKAIESFRDALEVGGSYPAQFRAWSVLGEAHEMRSEFDAAEDAYVSALRIRQKLHPKSLGVAISLTNLGNVARSSGDLERAHTYYLRALRICEELAPKSLDVASSLVNLGNLADTRGDLDRAYAYLHQALEIGEQLAPKSLTLAASLNNLANVSGARGDLEQAHVYYLQSLAILEELAPKSLTVATILNNLGSVAWYRGDLERAYEYALRALEIREQLAPKSLTLATSLNNLGALARARGELERAQNYHLQALRLREQLAPKSLDVAVSLNSLGSVAQARGELERAHNYYLQALEINEQLAPNSLAMAASLNNLGVVAWSRGELERADHHFIRGLRIREQLAPKSLTVAASLNNLGNVAQARGEFDRAHDYYLRALRINKRLAPQSLAVAVSLNNLGIVTRARGELERAHRYYHQALQIHEQLAPRSLKVANSLNNLGAVAQARGELDRAQDYYLQALQIHEQRSPKSLVVAGSLNNLGSLARTRGAMDLAHDYHARALKIYEQFAPRSLILANSLNNLGVVVHDRGDLDLAQDYYLQALRIREQLAPQSLEVAGSLKNLGGIARDRRELDRAVDQYRHALEALEHQVSKLGGSYNAQAGFRVQHDHFYHDTLDLLLTQSRFDEAFHVVERFRAQTFLTMLTERDTTFTADIPEEFDRERRRLAVRYDRTLKRLAGLNLKDDSAEIIATRNEIEKLHDEAGDLEARIRWASPRLAALKYPRAIDAAGAQQALDPGTLLLCYSVGEEDTRLFVLFHTGDLQVKILPFGQEALRFQVKRLRSFVREAWPGSLSESRLERFQSASRELYDALLEPVNEQIAASKRLLILPDGPLHALPFAALVRGGADAEGGGQYLVEWRPLHVALSATVYAELKERRPDREANTLQAPIQLAAFGDPRYPQSLAASEGEILAAAEGDSVAATAGDSVTAPRGDAVVRSAAERGVFDWPLLPYTRHEVEGIASLFPKKVVRTYLGSDALEERIKSLDPSTRILHLAAHVHTDEHLPMSSFVALTIPVDLGPERDNGLLQVWEIFERVRIDADLVVLSACESGLGQELGGEGLIGLTRAFQYAGARSVAASLWSVPDQTTAELIIRFYRHMRSGLPKDEALRAAQLELIRGPIEVTDLDGQKVWKDASAPYYWAAFQIFGDWQ